MATKDPPTPPDGVAAATQQDDSNRPVASAADDSIASPATEQGHGELAMSKEKTVNLQQANAEMVELENQEKPSPKLGETEETNVAAAAPPTPTTQQDGLNLPVASNETKPQQANAKQGIDPKNPEMEKEEQSRLTPSEVERKSFWESNFEQLQAYKDLNGTCLVPASKRGRPVQLGVWVANQRGLYRRGFLSQERIEKLNSLGFVWDIAKKKGQLKEDDGPTQHDSNEDLDEEEEVHLQEEKGRLVEAKKKLQNEKVKLRLNKGSHDSSTEEDAGGPAIAAVAAAPVATDPRKVIGGYRHGMWTNEERERLGLARTGRWTDEEKERLRTALINESDWESVEKYVGTRGFVALRAAGPRYFPKLFDELMERIAKAGKPLSNYKRPPLEIITETTEPEPEPTKAEDESPGTRAPRRRRWTDKQREQRIRTQLVRSGKWSDEEKGRLQKGLINEADWESVQSFVGTRSMAAVKSCAPKFFPKLFEELKERIEKTSAELQRKRAFAHAQRRSQASRELLAKTGHDIAKVKDAMIEQPQTTETNVAFAEAQRRSKASRELLAKAAWHGIANVNNTMTGQPQKAEAKTVAEELEAARKAEELEAALKAEELKAAQKAAEWKRVLEELQKQPLNEDLGDVEQWNRNFEALRRFKDAHGNCSVPSEVPVLGEWVDQLREERKKLVPERKAKLKEIGFDFSTRQEVEWKLKYKRLKAFKEEFGHTKVPHTTAKPHLKEWASELGKWVKTQREEADNGTLEQWKRSKLNSVQFVWSARDSQPPKTYPGLDRNDRTWMETYDRLCAYKEEYGDCLVPATYKEDEALGRWVQTQRASWKEKRISADRKKLLNKIGFVWTREKAKEARWDDSFQWLVAYKEVFGVFPTSSQKKIGEEYDPLPGWACEQRRLNKEGKLAPRSKRKLKSIGFFGDPPPTSTKTPSESLTPTRRSHRKRKRPDIGTEEESS